MSHDQQLVREVRVKSYRLGIRIRHEDTLDLPDCAILQVSFTRGGTLRIVRRGVSDEQELALIQAAHASIYLSDLRDATNDAYWVINLSANNPRSRLCRRLSPRTDEELEMAKRILSVLREVNPLPPQWEDRDVLAAHLGVTWEEAELIQRAKHCQHQRELVVYRVALERCIATYIDAYYATERVPVAVRGHHDDLATMNV